MKQCALLASLAIMFSALVASPVFAGKFAQAAGKDSTYKSLKCANGVCKPKKKY